MLVGLESSGDELPEFSIDFPLSAVLLGQEQDLVLAGEPSSRFFINDHEFVVSARSFFQVNLNQAEALVEHVLKKVDWDPQMTVFDLYCGVGLFFR